MGNLKCLLENHWTDFKYIWQEAFLWHIGPYLFKQSRSASLVGGHLGFWSVFRNVFKNLPRNRLGINSRRMKYHLGQELHQVFLHQEYTYHPITS
jgi:hypothetical protein